MKRSLGFTLIEVLIALAILAIAVCAVLKALGDSARASAQLQGKMAAHWLAMNKIAECQVGLLSFEQENQHEGRALVLHHVFNWSAQRQASLANFRGWPLQITVKERGQVMTVFSGWCDP
jgi:general secretion pathway protein I